MLHVLRGVAVHRLGVGAHREEAVVAAVGIDAIRGTLLPHVGRTAAEGLGLRLQPEGHGLQFAGLSRRRLWGYGSHRLAAGNGHRNARLVLLASGSSQVLILMILLLEITHGVGLA